MFAKTPFAVAAIALSIAGGAFAQSTDRNVFDNEAILKAPAAQSANGLTREAVQGEYIAQRAAKNISSFNPESWRQAEIAGSGSALVALFTGSKSESTAVASAGGKTREEVRAEYLAARASGEVNPFDTETALRLPTTVRVAAPTALAQR